MFKFKRYEDAKEARIFVETDHKDLVSVTFLSLGLEVRPLHVEVHHGVMEADRAEQLAHAILQAIAQARVEV